MRQVRTKLGTIKENDPRYALSVVKLNIYYFKM
jgi:hypothetical protein